jgi:hypothetical protein
MGMARLDYNGHHHHHHIHYTVKLARLAETLRVNASERSMGVVLGWPLEVQWAKDDVL